MTFACDPQAYLYSTVGQKSPRDLFLPVYTPKRGSNMSSLTRTITFCFPDTGSTSDYPLNQRDMNGMNTESERGGLQHRPNAINWGKQEKDDLSRNVKPISISAIVRSFAPDWCLAAVLWFVLAILNRSGGHKREFSLNDISIQHSHAEHERVPPL